MNEKPYRICSRCVMDTSDTEIVFDENGVCNHCIRFDQVTSKRWYPNNEGKRKLNEIVSTIKNIGINNEYDCIIGLSGGIDSSYLALKVHEWGLRPLALHVDAGWNSELAVANIEKIINYCGYDLYTHVVEWDEMRDLQVSYLRSGVSNQDVPQDHVFFASMYHFAIKNRINYLLFGGNIATESIFPTSWQANPMDAKNLKAIHKKYGKHSLKTYSTINFFKYYFLYPFIKKMRTVRPLNYMPYNKEDAIKELESTVGFRPYPRKHGESLFTKFFQNYYLPTKFGYDKRRPHLSSLIMSGQMTREEALKIIEEPLYDPIELENDIVYLCRKLNITRTDFEKYISNPAQDYSIFPNSDNAYRFLKAAQSIIERILFRKINLYS